MIKESFAPRKILFALIIGAIVVAMALSFGPGSFGSAGGAGTDPRQATGPAATVNGKEIPLAEFNRAYAMQLQFFRGRGQAIPENLARQIGIPKQVLEQLVNTELLAQAAEKHGLSASDEELADVLAKTPDFQKDGRFDEATYRQVVTGYMQKTPQQYEADQRRRLSAYKMLDVVEAGAHVSDEEVRARFEKEGNRAKLVYVRFLPAMFTDKVGTPTPAQLQQVQTERAKEISEYYEANRFTFAQPERVRARQLLVKLPAGATAAQKAEAKAKAEALKKELDGGKDFATLARAQSDDAATKAKGGELGWVERGTWEPALSDAVFALAAGGVTAPVETGLGFHVVKVEEKQAAVTKTLEQAQADIARTLWTRDQAKARARAEADKALAALKAGKSLKDLYPPEKDGQPAALRFEQEKRPEAVETDAFSASSDSVPNLGPAPELVKAVFARQGPGALDAVYPAGDALVVANVVERSLPNDETFAKQEAELRQQARQAKTFELRDAFLKALRKNAQVTTNEQLIGGAEAEG